MADRKALILKDNRVQEIEAGDNLLGANSAHAFPLTNGNAGSLVIGTPVYISAANTCDAARANADATADVVGLIKDVTVAAAATAQIQTEGTLTATTLQWDAVVTGASGGLVPGTRYILDPDNEGKLIPITDTIDAGEWVVMAGTALSTTVILINIEEGVKRN